MKLSVVILTHNSSDVIRGCLNSIKTADEIIIIDDYSSDSTLSLAKLFQPTIIQNKLSGFSHQRNLGLKQVKSDWVLFLDSDERVPNQLFNEIKTVMKDPSYSAYRMKRLNYFFGQAVKHGGYWPDWQTRLFKVKDFQRFIGEIHETPQFSGKLGNLDHHLIHFSHKNLIEGLQKSLKWTQKEAFEFVKTNHPQITWWRMAKVMLWEFCFRYFKKKAFLDGYIGFTESLIQAINRFFVYQQIWELQQKPSLKEQYLKLDKTNQ